MHGRCSSIFIDVIDELLNENEFNVDFLKYNFNSKHIQNKYFKIKYYIW